MIRLTDSKTRKSFTITNREELKRVGGNYIAKTTGPIKLVHRRINPTEFRCANLDVVQLPDGSITLRDYVRD